MFLAPELSHLFLKGYGKSCLRISPQRILQWTFRSNSSFIALISEKLVGGSQARVWHGFRRCLRGCFDCSPGHQSRTSTTPSTSLMRRTWPWALTSMHANGTVFHSVAIHVILKCAMQFHCMPYDVHGCFLLLMCYSEMIRSIRLRPREGALGVYLDRTGVGVLGDRMFSPTWFMGGEESIIR